jgi:hypothetical protein
MKRVKRGARVMARNSYSQEHERGTVIDFDKINGTMIIVIYFDEFGQVLECTRDEVIMIDCEECFEYANKIFERGEIESADIHKLMLDRHVLKGCDKILDFKKITIELEKLHEFLYGAHLATNDHEACATLHRACHTVTDIIHEIKLNGK